jgi:hypothetical protein
MENSTATEIKQTKKIENKEKKPINKILLIGLLINLPFILFFVSQIICLILILASICFIAYLFFNLFKKKNVIQKKEIQPKKDYLDELKNTVNLKNPWWN